VLDERGCLRELSSRGHNYAGGQPVWRLFYEQGQRFQQEWTPATTVEKIGDTLRLRAAANGLTLEIAVRLTGDESHWTARVTNRSADLLVKELQFPLVGGLRLRADQVLITTALGGMRYRNPRDIVRGQYPATRHWYQNEDHHGWQVQQLYPSLQAAGNCFTFAGQRGGLYCGSHDPTFRNTVHLWRLTPPLEGHAPSWPRRRTDATERVPPPGFEAGFGKHLFLKPGETVEITGYVLAPYTGSWHVAADKYRTWANTWFKPGPKPGWIKDLKGWQRLILKHQNGEVLFPYDSFPRIFADGKKAGLDCLFMFGWWPGGMDRMYPDYVPDPELGGEKKLRKNIRKFQDDLGGSVILYASGRLVDRDTDFFKTHGHRLAIKTRSGAEARDAYLFSNAATYERLYGAVELSPMCLDCPEWVAVLKRVIDLAVDYGCKGVFFDQLGTLEYPCYDPTHGHPVPYVTQVQGKRRVIAELRAYAKQRNPELAFGVEIFADAVGQYFDFVHGLYLQNYIARNDYQRLGVKPEYSGFVEWMRYTFPEIIVSDRDIRDETDFERRANYALLVGLVHDLEIYRCRRTIAAMPRYQKHLAKLNALRDRHHDLLVRGRYRDTLGFTNSNPEVEARAFVAGQRLAVVLTQSHLPRVTTKVSVPGQKQITVTLKRHQVAVLEFEI
jgi:hypothetical protein